MKKIILPAILSLLVCGFTNAQTTAKQTKPAVKPASSVTTTHTVPTKTAGNPVSKTNTQKTTPAATTAKTGTAIRRKHRHHAPKKAKK